MNQGMGEARQETQYNWTVGLDWNFVQEAVTTAGSALFCLYGHGRLRMMMYAQLVLCIRYFPWNRLQNTRSYPLEQLFSLLLVICLMS